MFAGDSVQLICHVSKGDTPLSISWSFHGRAASSHRGIATNKVGERTSLLSINNATATHSGRYSCSARNQAGQADHSTILNVHGTSRHAPILYLLPPRTSLAYLQYNSYFMQYAFSVDSRTLHRTFRGGRVGVRR